ncbi:MAG: hypothetical protein M3340_02105 [Actinomycetota bacterium]|nr:hypothetical protein [Actinomycetota bacterium]
MRVLLVLCLALVAALAPAAAEAAPKPAGDTARGSGVRPNNDEFRFEAFSGVNGESPTGTMEYFDWTYQVRIRGEVRCMRVTGNRALLSGIITDSPLEPPGTGAEGMTMYFFAEDGGRKGADRFQASFGNFEDPCLIDNFHEPEPITSGQIAVQDCTALARNGKRCARFSWR